MATRERQEGKASSGGRTVWLERVLEMLSAGAQLYWMRVGGEFGRGRVGRMTRRGARERRRVRLDGAVEVAVSVLISD